MKILELYGSGKVGVDAGASASTVVHELANQFVRMGHQVTVADVKSKEPRLALDQNIEVIEVDVPSPIFDRPMPQGIIWWLLKKIVPANYHHYFSSLLGHYKFIKEIIPKLSLENYDVIHMHHGQQAIFVYLIYRKSYIYTNHWCYSPDDNSFYARIEKKIINSAIAAVGPGSYLKQFAPQANITIIPHGININDWIPLDSKKCRKINGDTFDDFIVIFVGMVAQVKGVHHLINAIQELSADLNRLKVYIIGSLGGAVNKTIASKYTQELMDQSKDLPVIFLGFMNNKSNEYRNYISAADIFVLPSENEAQGLVVLEALSMGKPVIVSNVGGLGEMVVKEVGYTFEKGNVSELARIIRHLYHNPKEVEHLSQNCRKYIERNFTWETIATRYLDLFESCIR